MQEPLNYTPLNPKKFHILQKDHKDSHLMNNIMLGAATTMTVGLGALLFFMFTGTSPSQLYSTMFGKTSSAKEAPLNKGLDRAQEVANPSPLPAKPLQDEDPDNNMGKNELAATKGATMKKATTEAGKKSTSSAKTTSSSSKSTSSSSSSSAAGLQ